jgi:hypothetical protein
MESNHLMPPYQDGATRRALPEWVPARDSNSPVSITEAADRHLSLPGMDLAMGVEPTQRRYECRMQPSTSRQKKIPWSPALNSNQLIRFTRPAHRRQCLQGMPMLATGSKDPGLAAGSQAEACATVEDWSERRESNSLGQLGRLELNQ